MGNRIRIIWALSLASAILLIGVQGYWLYNQYKHVVNTYAEELAGEILLAGEEEYKLRSKEIDTNYTFVLKKKLTNVSDSLSQIQIGHLMPHTAFGSKLDNLFKDSIMSELGLDNYNYEDLDSIKRVIHDINDSLKYIERNITNLVVWNFESDSSGIYKKSDSLNLSKDTKISDNDMPKEINKAITNFKNPFREELFDSILAANIPEINYKMSHSGTQDLTGVSSWRLSGNLFSPYLKVLYFYSPFENKGVVINVAIPSPPLFKSMAVQLLLSLALILLLISCLILQIKTILKQKKINEMREDFVHAMIHELKRPVQTLKTFISLLGNKDMRSDETITEQVIQDSMFELDNLSAYLKKLKDMIHADNDATSLKISCFNIKKLIDKIVRLVNNPLEKDVNISVSYEVESFWIEADIVHIANVVNNLIENAIKYSAQHVDIEIKVVLEERELYLTVSDNGIGIPSSEQEKVFAKFYRGSNFSDKNIPGIGLGLSYVKLITEAHKGKVSLLSDIGKGTSITICLPQNK